MCFVWFRNKFSLTPTATNSHPVFTGVKTDTFNWTPPLHVNSLAVFPIQYIPSHLHASCCPLCPQDHIKTSETVDGNQRSFMLVTCPFLFLYGVARMRQNLSTQQKVDFRKGFVPNWKCWELWCLSCSPWAEGEKVTVWFKQIRYSVTLILLSISAILITGVSWESEEAKQKYTVPSKNIPWVIFSRLIEVAS